MSCFQAAQPTSPNLVAGAPVGPVQLVMDPRGFIVGTVAPQASTSLTGTLTQAENSIYYLSAPW